MKSFKPRKTPKQSRSQVTQKQILEAATRLWNKGAGHSVTTNHIARATGISIGTLYKYYPNKESILCDVARQMMAEDIQLVAQLTPSQQVISQKNFEKLVDAVMTVHKQQTHIRAFVYQNLSRLKLLEEATETRRRIQEDSLDPTHSIDPVKMWIAMNCINGILHATTQLPEAKQDWVYAKSLASTVISTLFVR